MLTPSLIIQRKRDGEVLTPSEIRQFVGGIPTGVVADYQATALLMAIYLNGMNPKETVGLVQAMLESGERYDLSEVAGPKVDKHSTGGVGDKVSLILAPLAAACGLKVPMMAGRGLGHTGGTIDKLEAIPGFSSALTHAKFVDILKTVGAPISAQTDAICPADKKLYALRDVTATIDCLPLIVASILSKKVAEGTQGLVLDVKTGNGAFMKTREQSRALAKALVGVARQMGLKCRALVTDMNQPLGYTAGNSLEVIECIEVLRGTRYSGLADHETSGSADLKELTLQQCAHMLEVGGVVKNLTSGRKLAAAKLEDGSAWKKFEEIVAAQGGSLPAVREPLSGKLPLGSRRVVWKSKRKGHLNRMNTEALGQIVVELGGGRKRASDRVDPTVGLVFHRKLGSRVAVGDPLVTVHAAAATDLAPLERLFFDAIEIGAARKPVPKLVYEVVKG